MKHSEVEKVLKALFKMQEIDIQIAELKISKVYKPKILSELRESVDSLEVDLASNKEKLQKAEVSDKNMQLDIDKIKERLVHAKEKLAMVTSNREYEAVQDEIIENEEMLAQQEEELLSIYDEEEECRGKIKDLEKRFEEEQKDSSEKIEKIEGELSHVEDNIKTLENKRDKFIVGVPKRILSKYNRIRKGHQNHAVVNVRKRACGSCMQNLPPQRIQDLKRGDDIVTCSSCGVILAWHEEFSPE